MKLMISKINVLDRAEFTHLIGPVFEESPWIAERTWPERPFRNVEDLHRALCKTVARASEAEQLALICAHPDLVGRAARAGTLTPESTREQAGAGLDDLSSEEISQFENYNEAYKVRFGFPFVICARENKKAAILEALPVRLRNDRSEEIETALKEIEKIAWHRLQDLIAD